MLGSCRDAAGNAVEAAHGFRYDATAPRLGKLDAESERKRIVISWQRPADVASVELARSPGVNGARRSVVYKGAGREFVDKAVRLGIAYRYELTAFDAAGNLDRSKVTGKARAIMYRPAAGAAVRAPVVLAWERPGGRELLQRPARARRRQDAERVAAAATLRIGATWRYAGRLQRLEPGLYRWYVWAARGTRERPTYGRALGSSTFVVKR